MQKFENVRNIYINNKKYSCCDWWQYDNDNKAWVFNGELFCSGWFKKGETIYKKCSSYLINLNTNWSN